MNVKIDTIKHKFRNAKPQKRSVDYNPAVVFGYYRKFLVEDFKGRCGYCDSFKGIVKKDYHIDHFVPQDIIKKFPTHKNLLNDYNNLIYSCPSCNRSKSGKWPSEHPDIHLQDEEGFINPCDEKYDDLFYRDENGAIQVTEESKTAKYIHKELKLDLIKHQVVWKVEKLFIESQETLKKDNLKDEKLECVKELMKYLEDHFEMGSK